MTFNNQLAFQLLNVRAVSRGARVKRSPRGDSEQLTWLPAAASAHCKFAPKLDLPSTLLLNKDNKIPQCRPYPGGGEVRMAPWGQSVAQADQLVGFEACHPDALLLLEQVAVAVVQLLRWCPTLCDPMGCSTLASTTSWSLLKLMSIESMMPSNHFILCHPFCFCPQSFPASRSFPICWLFTSGSQNIGALTSAMNIQNWIPLGLTGLISLLSKGTL